MTDIYEDIFRIHGFSKTQQQILEIVGSQKTVLEIGSSTGYMTRAFLDNGCTVDVVEASNKAVAKLPKGVRKILNGSIEDTKIFNLLSKDYEFVIMADVLEHLVNPESVLKKLREKASSNTKILISLPNIASWTIRKQLFFKGDFEYQDSGVLDRTHLHFYTVNTLPKLLAGSGWRIKEMIGTITRLPLEGLICKIPLVSLLYKKFIKEVLTEQFKNLSYYHILVIASKK